MDRKMGKETKILWVLKALLISYIVTGVLLVGLAFLLYKLDLGEQAVSAGIVAIYIAATLVGGIVIGKTAKVRRFVWGLAIGILYFLLLVFITLGVYRSLDSSGIHMVTTFLLCAGGGMIGGMIS